MRLKRGWKNGLVLIFIGGLMISTLIANGMGLIWHDHGLTGYEPVASGIAWLFSWLPATGAAVVLFYVYVVGSFINFINILSVRSTRQALPLNYKSLSTLGSTA